MKRILVVEDEQSVREIILDMLEAEAFQAVGAENALVGIELAKENTPDLIICDVMMPGMSGYEMLERLRRDPITEVVPFIFLTARATPTDLRHGMNLGADDYLTKPFTRQELLSTIQTRIQKQETIKQKTQTQLNQLRTQIMFALPHELRTPLNGIMSYSQILLEDFTEMPVDEVEEMLTDIQHSAQRLNRLVCNFLLYTDLELLTQDPDRQQRLLQGCIQNPGQLIAQVSQKVAVGYPERQADLRLSLCPDLMIHIDENAFRKITEELVDNALKFSVAGQPIQILSQTVDHQYCLSCVDQGRGMTRQQIAELGAYQQFDRSQYEQQGAGLGLAIVQRLVDLNNGKFMMESAPAQGTAVKVFFPIKSEEFQLEEKN
ncbi:MAG: response regulator [Microcoleaceae cyanobacterium]